MDNLTNMKITYFKYFDSGRSWFSKFDVQVISYDTCYSPELGKLGSGGLNYSDFSLLLLVGCVFVVEMLGMEVNASSMLGKCMNYVSISNYPALLPVSNR